MSLQVIPIDRVAFAFEPRPWPFAEAHRVLSEARTEAEMTTQKARREVDDLTRQKDAVTAQLGQMLSGLAGIMPSVAQASDPGKKASKSGDGDKVIA